MDGGPGGLQSMGSLESDMTERLHFHFSLSCIGEGNGNPLQCSCLENPRDGRALWAAIYGVAQSQTWLKRLSSSRNKLPLSTVNEPRNWGMIRAKVSMGDSCQIALSFRDYSDTAYVIRTRAWIFQYIAQGPFVLPLTLLQWRGNMGGNSHSPKQNTGQPSSWRLGRGDHAPSLILISWMWFPPGIFLLWFLSLSSCPGPWSMVFLKTLLSLSEMNKHF